MADAGHVAGRHLPPHGAAAAAVPWLGIAVGMALSYVVFFLIWQAVQVITQRVLGTGPALMRMLALVGSAAVIAYYLRDALVSAPRL